MSGQLTNLGASFKAVLELAVLVKTTSRDATMRERFACNPLPALNRARKQADASTEPRA